MLRWIYIIIFALSHWGYAEEPGEDLPYYLSKNAKAAHASKRITAGKSLASLVSRAPSYRYSLMSSTGAVILGEKAVGFRAGGSLCYAAWDAPFYIGPEANLILLNNSSLINTHAAGRYFIRLSDYYTWYLVTGAGIGAFFNNTLSTFDNWGLSAYLSLAIKYEWDSLSGFVGEIRSNLIQNRMTYWFSAGVEFRL
jgi:hypothetical protein